MYKHWPQISIILLTVAISACFDPPEFADEPVIRYRGMDFINYSDGSRIRDSLLLRFYFEDGNGDIGLGDEQTNYPFHPYDIFIDGNDSVITLGKANSYEPPVYKVSYAANGVVDYYGEELDVPNFNGCDFLIEDIYGIGREDTIYKLNNEFSRNLHITFYRKRGGAYSKINFGEIFNEDPGCELLNFDGRVPIFDDSGQGKAQSGTITYYLSSTFWETALSTDTFKVEFYIYDRALNQSNTVKSPDLTLIGISKNR